YDNGNLATESAIDVIAHVGLVERALVAHPAGGKEVYLCSDGGAVLRVGVDSAKVEAALVKNSSAARTSRSVPRMATRAFTGGAAPIVPAAAHRRCAVPGAASAEFTGGTTPSASTRRLA